MVLAAGPMPPVAKKTMINCISGDEISEEVLYSELDIAVGIGMPRPPILQGRANSSRSALVMDFPPVIAKINFCHRICSN